MEIKCTELAVSVAFHYLATAMSAASIPAHVRSRSHLQALTTSSVPEKVFSLKCFLILHKPKRLFERQPDLALKSPLSVCW